MNLLLSNDDGIYSAGIHALAMELKEEHQLYIVAPSMQMSGAGHSFTCSRPLRVREVTLPGLEGIPAFSVDGTPVDCVKMGSHNLGFSVDMVVSGINHGKNLGTDVLYSGTVGAAMEGALLGKPAIAVSNYSMSSQDFSAAARAARWAVSYLARSPLPCGTVLNINAPDCPADQVQGVKLAPLCVQQYEDTYAEFKAPRNARYFFLPDVNYTQFSDDGPDNDESWVRKGYVSLTQLLFDMTDYRLLESMDISAFSR